METALYPDMDDDGGVILSRLALGFDTARSTLPRLLLDPERAGEGYLYLVLGNRVLMARLGWPAVLARMMAEEVRFG
jgi:hypothetical protein